MQGNMNFMKKYIFFICAIAAAFLSCCPAYAWESYAGRKLVVYVVSIDEELIITVSEDKDNNDNAFKIRFYGVGIPNLKQPFGVQAHELIKKILPAGTRLIITTVNEAKGGGIYALVQLNDHSINNMLVDDGLAWVNRSTCKAFFCRRWHIQESLAIKERKGLWSLNIPTPPWQWGNVEREKN